MATEIRIVIADDHPVVRRGLQQAIELDPDLKVVAEAGDGQAVLAQIEQLKPDIAVLDMDMPKLDGLGAAREVRKRGLPVDLVFLTIHGEEDLFQAAIDLGAKAYILKESALTEIVTALRAVSAGQFYVTPSLTGHFLQRRQRTQTLAARLPGLDDLTPVERRIVQMIADNRTSKEIADELFIHYRTVENRRTAICQKLGLSGANALLKFALQNKSAL